MMTSQSLYDHVTWLDLTVLGNWNENRQVFEVNMFRLFGIGSSILIIPTLLLGNHKPLCKADDKLFPRIAIIGAGIGGSSAAHFSRKLFGSSANIHVFEAADGVGGRLETVEIGGKWYESGGSIIHPANKHMDTFVKELGEKFKPN